MKPALLGAIGKGKSPLATLIAALGSNYRVLVFDASNAGMGTLTSSKWSAVTDQSSNAYNGTQGTAANRFLNTGAINGRTCARSTKASATWMIQPSITLGNSRSFAFIYKCVTTPGVTGLYPLIVVNNGSDTDLTKIALNGSGIFGHPTTMRTHAATSGPGLACDAVIDTSPTLDLYTHSGTDPDTGYALYRNDMTTPKTLVSSGSLGLTPAVAPHTTIGVDYDGINGMSDVDFGVAIIGNAIPGAPERAAMKAYANAPVTDSYGGWGMSVA